MPAFGQTGSPQAVMTNKRNKLKKMLSPTNTPPPPPPLHSDSLLEELYVQLDSNQPTVQSEVANVLQEVQNTADETNTSKKDSRKRFEARQARKASALAAQIPPEDKEADARLEREAKEEEKAIQSICNDLGLVMHEINPDGHCLFAAIADQLFLLGKLSAQDAHFATTRAVASQYIYTHPNDFLPFLPSTEGEDGVGSADAGLMSPSQFEKYCVTIRDTGAWGGEPEILALSKAYNVPIHVVQGGKPPIVVHDPSGGPGDVNAKGAARISYHRRMYGLGEHYNSLRPKLAMSETIKAFLS